jgi:hypothetical protein
MLGSHRLQLVFSDIPTMAATAPPYTGGDDLDDGLDVAQEYIQATAADAAASDAGDAQGFFSDDEDAVRVEQSEEREEDDSAQVGTKRKATAGENGEGGAPLTDAEKKKKRKTQAKERREKVGKPSLRTPSVRISSEADVLVGV